MKTADSSLALDALKWLTEPAEYLGTIGPIAIIATDEEMLFFVWSASGAVRIATLTVLEARALGKALLP